ncbi:MAG TPA: DMT family transporter [bacterium]|nr:DMT family transporter [bacterium]
MFQEHIGELAALGTALCWAANALFFEDAGKRVGSFAVNFIRIYFGLIFLSIFTWITRGMILPVDASAHAWFWLGLSGVVGVVIGDLMLFEAFVVVGARVSMLIMSLVPIITAIISWLVLGETMTALEIFGMVITITGVSLVILERRDGGKNLKFRHPIAGVLFALGGATGQAIGLVLSKLGMGDYNAFASTQIRLIIGSVGFLIVILITRKWSNVTKAFRNAKAMKSVTAGSFVGPFLGISLSLVAVQFTRAGIASTIIAISPVIIIPFSIAIFNEKVTPLEIFGAFISVAGVSIYFLT